jgi:RNA polymerase sigma factor (sigma-70 family)
VKEIDHELECVLAILTADYDHELLQTVIPIIQANYRSGRAQRFSRALPEKEPLLAYGRRVVAYYQSEQPIVTQLLLEKNEPAWETFFITLQKWAYSFLRKRGFAPSPTHRYEQAVICATQAATRLLELRFPYDVVFQAWACVVTQNTCRHHISQVRRTNDQAADPQVAAERWPDLQSLDEVLRTERGLDLRQALAALTPNRRQFIELHYYEQKSFTEVAATLGTNVGALYKLHHDALEELRKNGSY